VNIKLLRAGAGIPVNGCVLSVRRSSVYTLESDIKEVIMKQMTSIRRQSGVAMVLGFISLIPGALLYLSRPAQDLNPVRLLTERGFIIAAVIFTAIGFILLKEYLTGRSYPWAVTGASLFLIGTVLIITAESLSLSGGKSTQMLVVMYVVLALLVETVVGIAIILSDKLPALTGWATIAWNVAWILKIPSTQMDVYIPVLHQLMPLMIGCVLIFGRADKKAADQEML
jgi:hypothetical protein